MNHKYLLSIVIPVYNAELYLDQCINSIINQKSSLIELIIVDDGSSDNSRSLILQFSKLSNVNFIFLEKTKFGPGNARNKGLDIAQGKYVAFVDSDDYLNLDYFNVLYPYMLEDVDLILFSGQAFLEKGFENFNVDLGKYIKKHNYDLYLDSPTLLKHLLNNKEYQDSVALFATKRSVLIKHDIRFKEGIIHEDVLFTIELFLKSKSIRVINDILYYRRYRKNSIMTASKVEQRVKDLLFILIQLSELANEIESKDLLLTFIERKTIYVARIASSIELFDFILPNKGFIKEIAKVKKAFKKNNVSLKTNVRYFIGRPLPYIIYRRLKHFI
jgi:glycosyltransferase involved in cell wall biosynthesis